MLKLTPPGALLVLSTLSNVALANPSDGNAEPATSSVPNRELLEFLADFDDMDSEEFELLVSYAQKDSEKETKDTEVQENE